MTDTATPARPGFRLDPELVRGLAVAGLAGTVLALTGAFQTHQAPLGLRLAYWIFLLTTGGLWAHVLSRLIERHVDVYERPWVTVAALTAVIAVPMTPYVWAITGPVLHGRVLPATVILDLFLPVLTVTFAVSAVNVFLGRGRPRQTHAPVTGTQKPARFLDRLPPRLRGARLIAVQAEDHYLRLHTDRGSDLILMRLSDAVAELEGLEGAQTHRSWWVARDAVRDVDRGDGRASLTLDGPLVAPVSRRHAKALRAAGWW